MALVKTLVVLLVAAALADGSSPAKMGTAPGPTPIDEAAPLDAASATVEPAAHPAPAVDAIAFRARPAVALPIIDGTVVPLMVRGVVGADRAFVPLLPVTQRPHVVEFSLVGYLALPAGAAGSGGDLAPVS